MIILDLKIIFCSETKTQFQFCYAKCKEVRNTQFPTGVEGFYMVLLEIFWKSGGFQICEKFHDPEFNSLYSSIWLHWGAVSGEFQIKSEQPMFSGAKVQPSLVQSIECKLLGTVDL